MPVLERTYGRETAPIVGELLISSDSHVIEPEGLWQRELPPAFQVSMKLLSPFHWAEKSVLNALTLSATP